MRTLSLLLWIVCAPLLAIGLLLMVAGVILCGPWALFEARWKFLSNYLDRLNGQTPPPLPGADDLC